MIDKGAPPPCDWLPVKPNKKGQNVSIHEEDNIVNLIPKRGDTTPINTTTLDALSNMNTDEPEVDMQSELTNYINDLSK